MADVKIKKTLSAADIAAIKAFRVPGWVNRDRDVKMVESPELDGSKTYKPALVRPLPGYLCRKRVRQVKAKMGIRNRIKRVDRGETLAIEGGKHASGRTQLTYHRVVRSGSLVVYEAVDHRTGKMILCIGGTAILKPEVEMTMAFDEEHWTDAV